MQNTNSPNTQGGASSSLKQEMLRLKTLLLEEIQARPESLKTDEQILEFIRAHVQAPESRK